MAKKKKVVEDAEAASPGSNDSVSSPEKAKGESAPMVTIIKTGTAAKLSPRGAGMLTYQLGRLGESVLVRIHKNDSSGRFSAEWVTVDALRKSLAQLPRGAGSFKGAIALRTAWKGQSSCNSGFGAAILRAENVFVGDDDPKKKGMLKLATPDALDAWEKKVLALSVPKDAEQVLLNPPKAVPNFAKRTQKTNSEVAAAAVEPVEQVEQSDDEDVPPAEDDE